MNGQSSPNVGCPPSLNHKNIIRNAGVIIWDEITIATKTRMKNKQRNVPFSGCVVVFLGDFDNFCL